jgi:hypothetical protein
MMAIEEMLALKGDESEQGYAGKLSPTPEERPPRGADNVTDEIEKHARASLRLIEDLLATSPEPKALPEPLVALREALDEISYRDADKHNRRVYGRRVADLTPELIAIVKDEFAIEEPGRECTEYRCARPAKYDRIKGRYYSAGGKPGPKCGIHARDFIEREADKRASARAEQELGWKESRRW